MFQLGRYDLVYRHGNPAYKRMLDRMGPRHARTALIREEVRMALLMEFRYEEAEVMAA